MNILSLIVGRDGCSGYRMKKPLHTIDKKGDEHQIHFLSHGDSEQDIAELIKGADVIMLRQQHEQMFRVLKANGWLENKLCVLDMDDDIFNITPFADTYRWGGVEEVKYDGKWLWKNGENNFDAERNKENLTGIIETMKSVDLVTCTTPYLKERLKLYSGNNIEVLPNSIDFTHWKPWKLRREKEIRIGWTGGATHYIDWYTIKNGLQKLFERNENIKLVLQGCKWEGTIKDLPYEYHDWIDFEGHPYKTASLNLDIAIIPLKDTLFNKSKSNIKWYEFSSLKVPCVVSNQEPYSTEIEHDKTGLLFNDEDEFVEQVERLINDTKLRKKIANNAYKWVKENRDLTDIADDYIEIFKKYKHIKDTKTKVTNLISPIEFTSVDEIEQPEKHLETVKSILDELKVKWCGAFGTALGFYRDKGFVPQDSDIDVMILADDVDVEAIGEAFEKHYKTIRTVMKNGKYHQIALQAEDKFIIDLCFFYKDGENYISHCEGGFWKDPVDVIGDFKQVETKYGHFPVPEKIEEYLTIRYGDWKTPKHGTRGSSIKSK